jgi:hypothetical protein
VAIFVVGRLVETVLPFPEAFDQLAGMVLERLADAAVNAVPATAKTAPYVDINCKFKDEETL